MVRLELCSGDVNRYDKGGLDMKKVCALLATICLAMSAVAAGADVGGGDLTFKPKDAKPVFFSHEQHVKVKTFKCSACHYHAFQMEKDAYKMDMTKITKGQFCGICHNGERSFDVKDKKSCGKCHK
jgi:c(7)-type cytochrome triheme protein